jgi:CRP-like cAMP-binding protein
VQIQLLKADQDIVRIGDSPSQCSLLVEGYDCVYKLTAEGKRQIVAFYVPGTCPTCKAYT